MRCGGWVGWQAAQHGLHDTVQLDWRPGWRRVHTSPVPRPVGCYPAADAVLLMEPLWRAGPARCSCSI